MNPDGTLSGSIPPASYGAKVIGTVLSAPANCKTNNNVERGGHLCNSTTSTGACSIVCYDTWATAVANFANNNGLYAISAGNEPDFASCGSIIGPPCNSDYASMVYSAKEMVSFVKVLKPKLNTGVKLISPETAEWIHLWSNTSATGSLVSDHPNSSDPLKCMCFGNSPTPPTDCIAACQTGNGYDYGHWLAKDSVAWGAIDILGTHEYDTQKAEPWPSDVNGGTRNKEIWMTEMSGLKYWPEEGPSNTISNGVAVAGWIHSALVVGEASAWLWFSYQAISDANEGLVAQGSTVLTKRASTLGNYSKFVRPGYVMVDVTGNSNTDLLLSAFNGPDGTVVVVAINKGAADTSMPITIAGGTAPRPTSCTPNVTSSDADLRDGAALTVTGGTFTASLPGTSVTTFVCK
jgi:glucuronoarabinoxylan endo-1,4-beta-xylanase